jgi:hypothetical protein
MHLGIFQLLMKGKDVIYWVDVTHWKEAPRSPPVSKDYDNKAFYEPQLGCTALISFYPSEEYCFQ